MSLSRRYTRSLILSAISLGLAACESDRRLTQSQACAQIANSFWNAPGPYKVLVGGGGRISGGRCFQVTGSTSYEAAISTAMGQCRAFESATSSYACAVVADHRGRWLWQDRSFRAQTDPAQAAEFRSVLAAQAAGANPANDFNGQHFLQVAEPVLAVAAGAVVVGGTVAAAQSRSISQPPAAAPPGNRAVPATVAVCDAGCQAVQRWVQQNPGRPWNGGQEFMNLGRP